MHNSSRASEKETAPEANLGPQTANWRFYFRKAFKWDGIRKPIDELLSPGTVPNQPWAGYPEAGLCTSNNGRIQRLRES
jgi:hypothetical protein